MTYKELKGKHEQEINEFPFMFAFDKEQFKKGMKEKFGYDPEADADKIYSIGAGGYIRTQDADRMREMFDRQRDELKAAMTDDNFIEGMFYYELCNHEYIYTGDYSETLQSLGLTEQEVFDDPRLLKALKAATKEVKANCD